MVSFATDISQDDAKAALAWLVEMGADELVSDEACDRFALQPTDTKRPLPIRQLIVPAAMERDYRQDPVPIPAATNSRLELERCGTLADVVAAFKSFDGCPLKKSATSFCFAEGNFASPILILGDRPRTSEEKEGSVFAGKNAELLANMLKAIGIADPKHVVLMNFLPWRPPGNRPPTAQEAQSCLPFVQRALDILRPSAILALGALPGQWLYGVDAAIPRQRGKWMGSEASPMISTFHPDDLMRSPALKKLAWADLKAFRERLVSAGALS
jgi:uracil-DNA glycosylase